MTALPFINGAYWIDNSTLDNWLACPREYEYAVIHRRENVFSRPAMNYGKALHRVLSVLVRAHGACYTSADLDALDAVLREYFEANPQPESDHRQVGLAQETLRRYIRTYEIENWKVVEADGQPVIERVIWSRLMTWNGVPVNYYGVLDLLVNKPDGLWVKDIKTTSRLGEQFAAQMAVSSQMRGYAWLLRKTLGVIPRGYIIDAIRSNAPGPAALKTQTSLNNWWAEQFCRLPFYLDEAQVAEWQEQTEYHITELFIQHARLDSMPTNRHSCVGVYGKCQFYDVCTLPFELRIVALQSNNFVDNTWTETTLKGKI